MSDERKSSSAEILSSDRPHLQYRPDIDGLRAIAILLVVVFHAFPGRIKGGFIGVDVFFVISGYLISSIILTGLENGSFSFIDFYSRRIRRIYPALLAVFVISLVFAWFSLFPDEFSQLGKHIAGGSAFISNFILWFESGYFDNVAETKPLLHLWSLGIEEQFYIFWPLLLWICSKKRFNLLYLIILVFCISFGLNLYQSKHDLVADFYSPQTRIWELLIGALLAYFSLFRGDYLPNSVLTALPGKFKSGFCQIKNKRNLICNVLAILGVILILFAAFRIRKTLSFPGKWALLPVAGTAFLIAAGPHAWFNQKVLSNRVLVWVGLISYPLYLWHWPLLSFARIIESATPARSIRIAAVALSFFFAWLTYRFIERPFRFGGYARKKAVFLSFIMLVAGSTGFFVFLRGGFGNRAFLEKYSDNKHQLIRLANTNQECLEYIGSSEFPFPYCHFQSADSHSTLAIIGDSHAQVAYPGIADYMKKAGINTIMMANSGCPPFIGSAYGKNDAEKQACALRTEKIIDTLLHKNDIKYVFIFSRGPAYITGKGFGHELKTSNGPPTIPENIFRESLQATIDTLKNAGKHVYYVNENPELGIEDIRSCIQRPFRITGASCNVDRKLVNERQKDYLSLTGSLKNVSVIETLDSFCDAKECHALSGDGGLLYLDDDHISTKGSYFQAETALKPYLDKIIYNEKQDAMSRLRTR